MTILKDYAKNENDMKEHLCLAGYESSVPPIRTPLRVIALSALSMHAHVNETKRLISILTGMVASFMSSNDDIVRTNIVRSALNRWHRSGDVSEHASLKSPTLSIDDLRSARRASVQLKVLARGNDDERRWPGYPVEERSQRDGKDIVQVGDLTNKEVIDLKRIIVDDITNDGGDEKYVLTLIDDNGTSKRVESNKEEYEKYFNKVSVANVEMLKLAVMRFKENLSKQDKEQDKDEINKHLNLAVVCSLDGVNMKVKNDDRITFSTLREEEKNAAVYLDAERRHFYPAYQSYDKAYEHLKQHGTSNVKVCLFDKTIRNIHNLREKNCLQVDYNNTTQKNILFKYLRHLPESILLPNIRLRSENEYILRISKRDARSNTCAFKAIDSEDKMSTTFQIGDNDYVVTHNHMKSYLRSIDPSAIVDFENVIKIEKKTFQISEDKSWVRFFSGGIVDIKNNYIVSTDTFERNPISHMESKKLNGVIKDDTSKYTVSEEDRKQKYETVLQEATDKGIFKGVDNAKGNDPKIVFLEKPHIYYTPHNVYQISVSSVAHEFQETFHARSAISKMRKSKNWPRVQYVHEGRSPYALRFERTSRVILVKMKN